MTWIIFSFSLDVFGVGKGCYLGGCMRTDYKKRATIFKRTSLLHKPNHSFTFEHLALEYFTFIMTWTPCFSTLFPPAKSFSYGELYEC